MSSSFQTIDSLQIVNYMSKILNTSFFFQRSTANLHLLFASVEILKTRIQEVADCPSVNGAHFLDRKSCSSCNRGNNATLLLLFIKVQYSWVSPSLQAVTRSFSYIIITKRISLNLHVSLSAGDPRGRFLFQPCSVFCESSIQHFY